MKTSRFSDLTLNADGSGFSALRDMNLSGGPAPMSACWELFLLGEAWRAGCDFEDLADGFGPGAGTQGDWSALRDSSPEAMRAMMERALNHLFPKEA